MVEFLDALPTNAPDNEMANINCASIEPSTKTGPKFNFCKSYKS